MQKKDVHYQAARPIEQLRLPYRDATQFMSGTDLQFFQEHFVKVKSLDDLNQKPIAFIIGEKGSGKSAFSTYFSNGMDADVSGMSLQFEKTDYDNFSNFASNLGTLRLADYSNIWESMLAIHSLAFAAHSWHAGHDVASPLSEIKELLSTFGHDQPLDRFASTFDIVCWNRQAFYQELKTQFPPDAERPVNLPSEMPQDFRTYLSVIRGFLKRLLKEVPPPLKKSFIFIDGLDVQSFDFVSSSEAVSGLQTICISGLVDAAWKLNKDLLFRQFDTRFRIITLIRPDIFERVGLHNMGTKLADNSIYLNWNTNTRNYESSDFFKVANNLLLPLVNEKQSNDDGKTLARYPWDAIFPLPYTTRSRKERHTFIEFLYNSFYRPRDLVAFLDIVKDTVKMEEDSETKTIESNIFNHPHLRQKYSEYLKSELKDSVSFYYGLDDFDILEKFFEFLSEEVVSFEFTRSAYEKSFRKLKDYIRNAGIKSSVIYDSADSLLQFLFEQNIVGAITKGANRTITLFSMSVRNSSTLRPRVPSAEKYRLHGGVARALYPSRIS